MFKEDFKYVSNKSYYYGSRRIWYILMVRFSRLLRANQFEGAKLLADWLGLVEEKSQVIFGASQLHTVLDAMIEVQKVQEARSQEPKL